MKVCIAEKPSVAKEIADVIGAKAKKDGYYEGNGYQVTWTFGHFCELMTPEGYFPHWKRWDLNSLPMLPKKFETRIKEDKGVERQFKVVKHLFDGAEEVINCGDAGQEGELIQRWVMKQAQYEGPVKRLWISSLTTEAIKSGFDNLMPAEEFDSLYYAGSSRAIGDWLLGINATRLYTLKYGAFKQVLSVGRVQTPTLAMLVNRYHEIENFVPQQYWELQTEYRDTLFNNSEGRFLKKEEGEAVLKAIEGEDLHILKVEKKEGKEYAPKLFDLTSLQVHANTKFGYTADETLKIVQRLYEMKVVTYPRVDTTFLPNDMYPKVEGILKGLSKYSEYTNSLIGKKIRKSAKVFNDKKVTDHHAIIPTGEERHLNSQEQSVYDAVVRRFIAVFYPDCIVAKTKVEAEVHEVKFHTTGKEILEDGWRILFKGADEDKKKGKGEEKILTSFEEGEHGPHVPSFLEKMTKAPSNYTEASLLRAMETAGKDVDDEELRELMKANGIGRPSTRANIIETLFRRKYIERRKKQVVPTVTGIQLINTISNQLLKSAELTGRWEKQLKEIENGEYSASMFINNMKKMVDHLVYEVRSETGKPRMSDAPITVPKKKSKKTSVSNLSCPKCQEGEVVKGKTSYGCLRYSQGCDFRIPFRFMGKKFTDKQIERLVLKGATTKLKGFKVDDEKVEGVVKLNEAFELTFAPSSPRQTQTQTQTPMPACPKCGKGTLIRGNTSYGCSEWKSGCDFRFTFENIKTIANGRPLTKDLVLEIIKGDIPEQERSKANN